MEKHDMNVMQTCKICGKSFNRLSRHVRSSHSMDFRDYQIIHLYEGKVPLCGCGCGGDAPYTKSQGEGFKRFIHGHHMVGKKRSDETKQKIGQKNSQNMKKYFEEHPEKKDERQQRMRLGITEESERRRIKNTKETYRNMDSEQLEKFSQHAKKLWKNGKMEEVSKKARETLRRRFSLGELIRTQEQKDKISGTITELYRSGGFQWSKGNHYSPKTGKMSYYRSSWELQLMRQLDDDQQVKDYQYEPFVIPYIWDGGDHRYLPDFLVEYFDGRKELIEVGPEKLKEENSRNQAKLRAARDLCESRGWTFRVVSF